MSFLHSKTNYVRPHTKTTYIKPLCGYNDNEDVPKDFSGSQFNQSKKYGNSLPTEESGSKSNSLKLIDDAKEKHIQNISSAHSKLCDEIERIQTWKTEIELECKQKNKKLDELSQIVETQRKVVLDFQMQNENLSLQLNAEIQQRDSVLEKFYCTKKLYSTLRKKFNDIQGQFDTCYKIKEAIYANNEEKVKEVESLANKYAVICIEYPDKITSLSDALKSEKNNVILLKDLCEQINLKAEKEHKSLCKLIENYQEELKQFAQDIKIERNKVVGLEHEKNGMLQKISDLEKASEVNLKKLEDADEQLKLTLDSKTEIENSFKSENEKVNNLNRKCEELEELRNMQRNEFEENYLALKKANNSLEELLIELKQKLEESESNNKKLSKILQDIGNEKSHLENEISKIKKEREELKEQLMIAAKIADEVESQLVKEKNNLVISLKYTQEELQKTLSDKENLSAVCSENEKKLSEITSEYSVAILKIEQLSITEEKYIETLKKVEEMEVDIQGKLELLASKELEVEEMFNLKLKCAESQNKIIELEDSIQHKFEQLELKDMTIHELSTAKEKLAEAENKIKELENEILSKNEIIISKEINIDEWNNLEKTYAITLANVIQLENDVQQKSELLAAREKMIQDLKAEVKENEKKLNVLKSENFEMKDNLAKEKENINVCLECEIIKDKVKEYDDLSKLLMDTKNELENQRQQTADTLKLLSETEDNFDEMRMNKEREIIKCKDTIQALHHEIRILKVETGDFQTLKAENEKLKSVLDDIKIKKNVPLVETEDYAYKKQLEHNVIKKQLENSVSRKQIERKIVSGEKMEADSSNDDDVMVLKEEVKGNSAISKRFSKDDDKKMINLNKNKSLSNVKRKRAWESESSGSEGFEIVYDKDAKKWMSFTPKSKPSSELKKTPNITIPGRITSSQDRKTKGNIQTIMNQENAKKLMSCTPKSKLSSESRKTTNVTTPGRITSSQDRKTKGNIQTIMDQETSKRDPIVKARTVISFNTKYSPMLKKKPLETEISANMDFLISKESAKQVIQDSPLNQINSETNRTPSTPVQRRFFKTPLKERDISFKKPQLQNMWF